VRRSKLEMYVDILTVLAHRGPLKLTHVMYKANVNCSVLKEYLDFLIKQSLVEERTVGKARVVFAVTQGIKTSFTHSRGSKKSDTHSLLNSKLKNSNPTYESTNFLSLLIPKALSLFPFVNFR
jgi:predicted transcriptional regulator